MPIYFAADLRWADLPIPGTPPPSLWSKLAGDARPVPVWLLTPATYVLLERRIDALDAKTAAGSQSSGKLAEAAARWHALREVAAQVLDLVEVKAARTEKGLVKLVKPAPLPEEVF